MCLHGISHAVSTMWYLKNLGWWSNSKCLPFSAPRVPFPGRLWILQPHRSFRIPWIYLSVEGLFHTQCPSPGELFFLTYLIFLIPTHPSGFSVTLSYSLARYPFLTFPEDAGFPIDPTLSQHKLLVGCRSYNQLWRLRSSACDPCRKQCIMFLSRWMLSL